MKAPSPALVVAVIALFVALGGTGYAVTALPRDSVSSAQIVDGSVQPVDLSAAAQATRAKASGARGPKGARGPAGAKGATGATGAQGARGETGAAGASGYTKVYNGDGSVLGTLYGVANVGPFGGIYFVEIGSRIWEVYATGEIAGSGTGRLAWATNACSGVPFYIYGSNTYTLPTRIQRTPYVVGYNDGTVAAYDVGNVFTTVVVPTGTTTYTKAADGTCTSNGTFGYPLYGTTTITALTPPTLISPLTIG